MTGSPAYEEVIGALAAALAGERGVGADDRRRAEALAGAAGIEVLVERLEMAERILRAGEGFHSIERFFVDDSDEQRYLIELHRRARGEQGGRATG